jgi:transposase
MPNLPAAALPVPAEDLQVLRRWAQASSVPASLAQRAKLLLLAAEGIGNTAIAEQLGITRPTVIAWRQRYTREGLDGLVDRRRPGRPQTVRRDRRAQILATTLAPPPQELGVTHWSSRLLAAELGASRTP